MCYNENMLKILNIGDFGMMILKGVVKTMSGILVRIKRFMAAMMVGMLCVGMLMTVARAEDSVVDLMDCIGRPVGELTKAIGGCQYTVYPQFAVAYGSVLSAQVTVERGEVTGWPVDTTYSIALIDENYALDGYRVEDAYADGRVRALGEGWALTGEVEDSRIIECFEKNIDGVDYALELRSDYGRSTIDFVRMVAIHRANLESALNDRAALETAHPNALGNDDGGFIFRNGMRWHCTIEEILALEDQEPVRQCDETHYREVYYSDATELWYTPGLGYYAVLDDTVNCIVYRYAFGSGSDEGEEIPYVVNRLNAVYGPADASDPKKLSVMASLMAVDRFHGMWTLDDGTTIMAIEETDGCLQILYLALDFFPLMGAYIAENPEM